MILRFIPASFPVALAGFALLTPASGVPVYDYQAYLKGSQVTQASQLGQSGAIDGDTAVVGAPNDPTFASSAGRAYVFVRDSNGTWTEQAILSHPNPRAGDLFGSSVAISGDTIVVGAPREDNTFQGVNPGFLLGASTQNSGAAWVFVRNGGTWTQQAYLKASNAGASHEFGGAVAIDGDTLVVGAADAPAGATPFAGAAYVFTRSGTAWSEQAILTDSAPLSGDNFGYSVDVDADSIAVGAPFKNSTTVNPGAAYFFVRESGAWSQQGAYFGPPLVKNRLLGFSVAISGNLAIAGAPAEGSEATGINGEETGDGKSNSGAAYILTRDAGVWTKTAFFKASNSRNNHRFGQNVAIDGRSAIVGAPQESSNATGANGDQTNNSLINAGATYLFQINDGDWTQIAYLKPSNTRAGFRFGESVSLSRGTALVGAPSDHSAATTINGDQSDTSLPSAGAAHAIKFAESGPDLALETPAGIRFLPGFGAIDFPVARVPLVVRNEGLSPLTNAAGSGGVELAISGPDAAFFTLGQAALPGPLAPDASAGFFLTFDPAGPAGTIRHATLELLSNDPTPSSFTVALTGTALSETDDSDGDGIPDATEFRLSPFGFDWQTSQPDLVALFFNAAPGAGLFTEAQIGDMNLNTPLIRRDGATGRFTLEITLEKSDGIAGFGPLPFDEGDLSVTPGGKLEFEFESTGDKQLFRLRGK